MFDSFAAPWIVACLLPLSMEFPRQEYWSGLPFPPPGDFSDPGVKPASFALAGGFFTTEPPGKFLHKFISHHLDNHWKHLIKKKDLLGILSLRYHEIQFTREDWTQQEQSVSVNVHVCVCVCVCLYPGGGCSRFNQERLPGSRMSLNTN